MIFIPQPFQEHHSQPHQAVKSRCSVLLRPHQVQLPTALVAEEGSRKVKGLHDWLVVDSKNAKNGIEIALPSLKPT